MPWRFRAPALFTVIGCLVAIEGSAQVVKQEVAGIRNFAKIESTVACAGAITPAAIADIKQMGFTSIINLRLASEQGADIDVHTAAAKAAGMPYYHIPFSASAPPTISINSLVMAAWRARFISSVSRSIMSRALLVALSIAVIRAPCSLAIDSRKLRWINTVMY